MPVQFENFAYSFSRKGKPVFVPNERGRRFGEEIKSRVEASIQFDDFYRHLRKGGHVGALHVHRPNRYFFRLDVERFFYSIGRNRVVRTLRDAGVPFPAKFGKWSCVKNPFADPTYALPYGFVQSPILATLVMMKSGFGEFLRGIPGSFCVSVYVDDITISSNDLSSLEETYSASVSRLESSGFVVNASKSRTPSEAVELFNCHMSQGVTKVTGERIQKFYSVPRSDDSTTGFERYRSSVLYGNAVDD